MTDHQGERDPDGWLADLFRQTAPSDPGPEAWDDVLARINAKVGRASRSRPPVRRRARRRRSLVWPMVWAGSLAAAAAAVLVVVILGRFSPKPSPVPPQPEIEPWAVAFADDVEILDMDRNDFPAVVVGRRPHGEDAWPVASDAEVEILSLHGSDLSAVVVGQVPHRGPLILAAADEITIDDTGHDVEVRVPDGLRGGAAGAPMIIMPLDFRQGRQ